MENEILNTVLRTLADQFEAGNRHFATFEPSSVEEYGPLRECLAGLIAEGSVSNYAGMGGYRFTPPGYDKYKSRIAALRALSQ